MARLPASKPPVDRIPDGLSPDILEMSHWKWVLVKIARKPKPVYPGERVSKPVYLQVWMPLQVFTDVSENLEITFPHYPGFSLVFSTTGKGPFQTSKAHLQLQVAGHSQLCHFLKHTVHRAYQKFSIEKFIMWTIHLYVQRLNKTK